MKAVAVDGAAAEVPSKGVFLCWARSMGGKRGLRVCPKVRVDKGKAFTLSCFLIHHCPRWRLNSHATEALGDVPENSQRRRQFDTGCLQPFQIRQG